MRFVVCGEALIDLVPFTAPAIGQGGGGGPAGRSDVPAGSTWPFSSIWEAQSAGGPMNTAVALGRLGDDVQFLGRLSRDVYGEQLAMHLRGSDVALDLVTTSEQATSLALVTLDSQRKASYVFHFADTANFGWRPDDLPRLEKTDWLHIASLATVIEPGASALLEWVRGFRGSLSYDINVRPTVIPDPRIYWETVRPWLEVCAASGGLVKASDDDIAFLGRGSGHGGSACDIAAAWVRELGLRRVVVTLGADGAAAVERDGSVVTVPGRRVVVADTVGAGDTFTAGMIDILAAGGTITDALAQGVTASAVVVSRVGAQPPTRAELTAATTEARG